MQVIDASRAVSMYPDIHEAMAMRIDQFTFGSIRIDGVVYEHDVVIARGRVRKRKKKSSKPFRDSFGHTPVSIEEDIPWDCRRLVVGTGANGALPVMDEVKREATRREVELLTVPTSEAIRALRAGPKDTNAILHVTC
ncbi:MAG: MTH938/NDUFAF3 family protein [Actinomycetota bacterium]